MANITYRLIKGTPLSNAEIDANFESLNLEKLERDGSIPMTGDLSTLGIKSTSSTDGLKLYNQNGELVATFGASNSDDVTIEGSINVGGGSNLSLDGGDITARNLFISGSIISSELGVEYGVSGDGDVFTGSGAVNTSGDLVVTIDVILKLTNITGSFEVGNTVEGAEGSGTITKVIDSTTLYVSLDDPTEPFVVGEEITYSTNSATILSIVDSSSFKENQKVKVFGASLAGASEIDETPAASASKNGDVTETTNYYYWIAQYRFDDGRIAASTKISGFVSNASVSLFNETVNNALSLNRTSADYGILVYRSIGQDDINQAKLIEVLGPNQLGGSTTSIPYVDYGNYSPTEWSTKNDNGEYTDESQLVHFPLTAPANDLEGWAEGTIKSVDDAETITLNEVFTLNTGSLIEFVHDNTTGIQEFINQQRDLGLQRVTLPNGVYYTSKLSVPSNFELSGQGKQTVLKQIPWNFDYWNDVGYPNQKGNVLVPQDEFPVGITFKDMSVDGNFINNVKFETTNNSASTYLVNIPNSLNTTFLNTKITNSVGGGIWAFRTEYLRIQDSEILNGGGVSYVGADISPLYAGESDYLTITNNLFENFLSPVDISVSRIGAVVGNTIRNCGSGMLIFGSAHLLSSPNLLMGPDNEFLPSPDTYDSDYNSININPEIGVDYESPEMLYVESSVPAYLGSTDRDDANGDEVPGSAVELSSDIRVLTQLNNSEILKSSSAFDYTNNSSDNPIFEFTTPDAGDKGRENGYFQFEITAANTFEIPTLADLITTHSSSLVTGEQIMGLAYRIFATTYLYVDEGERIGIASSEFSTDTSGDVLATITLDDANKYSKFIIGQTAKVFGHSSTPDIKGAESTIIDKIEAGLDRKIVLQLPDSFTLPGSPVNGANTGYITVRKTFTIAKGRIL